MRSNAAGPRLHRLVATLHVPLSFLFAHLRVVARVLGGMSRNVLMRLTLILEPLPVGAGITRDDPFRHPDLPLTAFGS